MNRIYPKLILAVLCVLAQFGLKAQVLQDVQRAFDAYQQNHLQEKLFVHTDKEKYIGGELLWFKIYAVNAGNNQPISLSKVAYVELLDVNNQPLAQAKTALSLGSGNGSIVLPTEFKSGSYKLRAYTNWMQNFGPASFFEKQLVLFNPLEIRGKATNEKTTTDLQFFPEGGDMIAGLPASVAFKALGADGKGKSLKGAIVNLQNDTVARFETFRFGMGRFAFTPQAGQRYKAVAGAGSEKLVKDLPLAKPQGYALLLEDKGPTLSLTVSTNVDVNEVYLFVHNGQNTSMAELAAVSGGKALFQIDKAKLGDGLAHFTVFNANAQAVAERLYFKKTSQKLKVGARSDLLVYPSRSKVNVDFLAQDETGKGLSADLSLSVRRLDSLQGMDQQDIQSYLWLSSELKGNIEAPAYYFQEGNADATQALDNLLLTQGWRRFAWPEVMQKGLPAFKFIPELQGHLISGKLGKNGAGVKYTTVYLSIPAKGGRFYESLTDANGNFMFNVPQLIGVNELVIQTDRTDTTSVISMANPFAEQFTAAAPEQVMQSALGNDINLYSLSAQVQNSFSAKQLQRFYAAAIDTGHFYGKPFRTYFLDDYTRFRTMEETLREYTTQVFVSKNQGKFNLRLLGTDVALNDNPLVLLDGVPYLDMNRAMEIDPNKVQKFDIIPETYFYGSSAYQGLLSFSSFKPNLASIDINPNAVVIDYDGMQQQREFYVPKYENSAQQQSRIPDFRNVLYWSPSVYIDGQGRGRAEFYTSDLPGTYIGVVNGLSPTGVPGTATFTFEVKGK